MTEAQKAELWHMYDAMKQMVDEIECMREVLFTLLKTKDDDIHEIVHEVEQMFEADGSMSEAGGKYYR